MNYLGVINLSIIWFIIDCDFGILDKDFGEYGLI